MASLTTTIEISRSGNYCTATTCGETSDRATYSSPETAVEKLLQNLRAKYTGLCKVDFRLLNEEGQETRRLLSALFGE